ncbi:MAG: MFS transporter [Chthoniobacteraceae bacterium]|nr:MFS transporter [Chthoniobacteraceae bacterium]
MSLETRLPGARRALALLLCINLFNYIDRYILAAVEPEIRKAFFRPDDPDAMAKTGLLATAFLVSYMVAAPLFGWLADRTSRWLLAGLGVAVWSLASGASGLAGSFMILLATRVFVGVGEAGYGPAAPALIADYFAESVRGRVLSCFYLAIPVGGALGYVFGGVVGGHWGWRWPFYLVTLPGLALGALCFLLPDPRKQLRPAAGNGTARGAAFWAGVRGLARNRSYLFNTAAMTAMTFAMGGMSFWMPDYIHEYRGQPDLGRVTTIFGGITVVSGLLATLAGGWMADRVNRRNPGGYFLVSGVGMLIGFPLMVVMLFTPFPWFWAVLFGVEFFLFFNTGPANAALVEVTAPGIRATAFAVNIFVIHALGDAISPPLIGKIAGWKGMNAAFLAVSALIAIAGLLWIWGARYLEADTRAAEVKFTES